MSNIFSLVGISTPQDRVLYYNKDSFELFKELEDERIRVVNVCKLYKLCITDQLNNANFITPIINEIMKYLPETHFTHDQVRYPSEHVCKLIKDFRDKIM